MRRAVRSTEVSDKSRTVGGASTAPRLPLALSFQSLVGNRATSQLVAQRKPQVSVMRTIATTPQQMKAVRSLIEGPIGGQSSYDKLRGAVKAYHARSHDSDALLLVDTILGLADSWITKYGNSTDRSIVAKRRVVETLQAEALREKGVLRAQARYVKDVEEQQFRAMRHGKDFSLGTAKNIVKGENIVNGSDLSEREARGHDLATEFKLTSAEITAIRFYSMDDYKYINPAVANDPAWMETRNKNQQFMDLPLADGEAEVDEDMAPDHLEEGVAPRTDTVEDLADQVDSGGPIRTDAIDAMPPSAIDATGPAKEEAVPSSSLSADAARVIERNSISGPGCRREPSTGGWSQ